MPDAGNRYTANLAHTLIISSHNLTQNADLQFSRTRPQLVYITHTPYWVFALFIGLCLFGVLQARTRRVRPALALLLPVGMLILSVAGVLQYTSLWLAGLACWMLGVAVSATLLSRLMSPSFVTGNAYDSRLLVQGRCVPLLVILGIFLTRYTLGVAHAMHAPILEHWPVQMTVAWVLGAWSGYFALRGWGCWRVIRSMRLSAGLV